MEAIFADFFVYSLRLTLWKSIILRPKTKTSFFLYKKSINSHFFALNTAFFVCANAIADRLRLFLQQIKQASIYQGGH